MNPRPDAIRALDELSLKASFDEIESRLGHKERHPLQAVREALAKHPGADGLLEIGAYAALVEDQPDVALRYLKRFGRFHGETPITHLARAVATAMKGNWAGAHAVLVHHGLTRVIPAQWVPPGLSAPWLRQWMTRILAWTPETPTAFPKRKLPPPTPPAPPPCAVSNESPVERAPLPVVSPRIPINFALPDLTQYEALEQNREPNIEHFRVRTECARLGLLKGFDELLCTERLRGVDYYWYQVETVRKALKQFRGRVLLADEVGLGKTIEAGMVLKEYLLRGMANRVLILTPPSLVGQWKEEMESKFAIDFITTHGPLLQNDAAAFWAHPRIIASIATARRDEHLALIGRQALDLVIVDEAHHVKNRASKNWKLIDGLQKRFLFLLSATPVQNNLVELYNLLTLLKPGIFKTEKEFRTLYVTPGKPRVPLNRQRLQDLMRDVMIRNTRSMVDVRLPPRHAVTRMVEPTPNEQDAYRELSRLIRETRAAEKGPHHLSQQHMLEAAGSSARAAATAVAHFLPHAPTAEWQQLHERYKALGKGTKAEELGNLLEKNPDEKKMVFVRFRETLNALESLCDDRGIPYARFDGRMSGPEKDQAIERFRSDTPVLLSTESGGEGRNVQFCNTVINFDLPWNPQRIEQRIGRVHRIGQTREVFIFNLAARGTVEEQMLKILDEKVNMFELVVGEIQSILGEMEEEHDFAHLIFTAWVRETQEERERAFQQLGDKVADARSEYEAVKALDDELFGEEFEAV
ncbi:MAG: SNF2-related protein [bacterium]